MNVFDEDVPLSVTRLFGHVCGVIAAAMAVVTGYGSVRFVTAIIEHHASWLGVIPVSIGIALTTLFFRWAGVLTGYWKTQGRLAVPASVYAGFGVLFAAMAFAGVYVLLARPLEQPIVWIVGVICGSALTHWVYVLLRNPRK